MSFHNTGSRRGSSSVPKFRNWHVLARRTLTILAVGISLGAGDGSYGGVAVASGGSCRSQHFVVSAPSTEMARQVCEAAERFRKTLAVDWLGEELPEWQDICPIQVMVGPHLGAGGATSFTFINGQPRDWHMEIQGSRDRILDSVLPHEITHMVLATHLGRPLPRWADEGAATSVEHTSERSKQEKLLIQFLLTDRGIAFNHMFAMKEYPQDILPLYSQGYSLARYLIARGGKRAFVDYVGDGMNWGNWTAATQKHYGMHSLSDLQVTWLEWVKQGSPEAVAAVAVAANTQPAQNASLDGEPAGRAITSASGLVPLPSPVAPRSRDRATADGFAPGRVGNGFSRRLVQPPARQSGESPGGLGNERTTNHLVCDCTDRHAAASGTPTVSPRSQPDHLGVESLGSPTNRRFGNGVEIVIGHWSVVIGHWSFVIGCWSLTFRKLQYVHNQSITSNK